MFKLITNLPRLVLFAGVLLANSSLHAQQAAKALPSLPPLPEYPAVTQIDANTSGEIYFQSTNPGDYKQLVLADQPSPDITVKALLTLPNNATAEHPVSAMVILHGSGGILPSRELDYAKWLAGQGVATMVIDTYAARGVTEQTPYGLRVAIVSDADEVADAYAALKLLNQHPLINHNKIGVMGFSYGGMATRAALDKRIYQNLANGVAPFALHVDFYGPCHFSLQSEHTTGAPYFSFRGAEDASNDLARCAKVEQHIRQTGSTAGSHIFANAGHGWEMTTERKFVATLNPAPCEQLLTPEGNWQLNGKLIEMPDNSDATIQFQTRLQLLGQMKQSCMSEGYIMGKDNVTHVQSNKMLFELIQRYL
ncbi:dienelactone hydrolase family protein [Neptunicella marina]|uniref:Dienelactone hydrolase family protein n=1 Tax=Neptunicella marina TaxID=2125989 RepID=A0A8J6IVD8_9ALTE|nr:dienelactone hydrolase family protein [Neptunicella marina]MBC3767401.1 dienelactone hydrolase family protein [Neptunicella marina]